MLAIMEAGSALMHEERDRITGALAHSLDRAAKRMGLSFGEEQKEKAALYLKELLRWNRAYNLVGRRLGPEELAGLFVDAITPLGIKGLLGGSQEVLDIGAGAGMPGIPLYIMGGPFPLTLMEAQRKKVTFLRHICKTLALEEAQVYAGRLEEARRVEDMQNAFDLVLARAVMEPLRLCRMARPLLAEGGTALLYLGKKDMETVRKKSAAPGIEGWRMEAVRSTQRIVQKDLYLVLLRKSDNGKA
jgi:16S rRNA (guanine527-N7)-methyltransferase